MSEFIVRDTDRGNERPVESRSKAEEVAEELRDMGASVEIIPPGEDGNVDVVEHEETPKEANTVEPDNVDADGYDLPDDGPSVDEDPLVWMPDEFTDTIDGSVAINRKGFEVLAHHYSIQCETELCSELTANGRVAFKAVATDADGDTYSAFGSASDSRGDDAGLLVEMADTRAYKRAISRATGVGMVAVEELQNEL
jgi:hypothetical protein